MHHIRSDIARSSLKFHNLNQHPERKFSRCAWLCSVAFFVARRCAGRWASARNTPSSSWPSPLDCVKVWSPSSSWWASSPTSKTSAVCPFPSSVPWSCRDWWDAASSRAPRRWGKNQLGLGSRDREKNGRGRTGRSF